jgi:predicted outer membrane repeat protein
MGQHFPFSPVWAPSALLLIFFLILGLIATSYAQLEESNDPRTINLWISASIGDDSNDGSLKAPLKSFERAINLTKEATDSYITFHLSPGNYSVRTWVSMKNIVQIVQRCIICPEEPTPMGETVVLGIMAPAIPTQTPPIRAHDSSFFFYNISFQPLPNIFGAIDTMPGVFLGTAQTLLFEDCEFTGFSLGGVNLPLSLIILHGGSSTIFRRVHWHSNMINVTRASSSIFATGTSVILFGRLGDTASLEDCVCELNTVIHDSVQGGMISGLGILHITRSRFSQNTVIASRVAWGGVLAVMQISSLRLTDSIFEDNRVGSISNYLGSVITSAGGAIHVNPASDVEILNSTFERNQAFAGGALSSDGIYSTTNGKMRVSGCHFTSNVASVLGAAMYLEASKRLGISIENCTFDSNLLNAEADRRFFGVSSPSTIYLRGASALATLDSLIFQQTARFLTRGYRPNHRITVVASFTVRIVSLTYLGISVRSTEGEMLILQDIPELFLSGLKFDSIRSEATIFHSTNPCLVLIDANSDTATVTNVLLLSNFHLSALDLLVTTPYFHIRNTDWVFVENIHLSLDSQSYPSSIIFFHNLHSLELSDVKLIGVHAQILFQDIVEMRLRNVEISDCQYALPILDFFVVSSVSITNSVFVNSKSPVRATDVSRFQATDSQWIGCNAGGNNGGAVFLTSVSTSTFRNCSFTQNSASNGGAVFSWDRASFVDCKFINNSAAFAGGAFYGAHDHINFQTCNFSGNTSPIGGAVYLLGSDLVVSGSTFTRNEATISSGGAIQLLAREPLDLAPTLLSDTSFIQNYARTSGGAIDTGDGGNVLVVGSTFQQNVAGPREILDLHTYSTSEFQPLFGKGGAIHGSSKLSIQSSRFEENLANSGGAVHIAWDSLDRALLYMDQSEFVGNLAAHSGGALTVVGGTKIREVPFAPSKPHYLPFGEIENTQISNCKFIGNSAYYYGGVLAMSFVPLNLSCGANQFINSTAKYGGVMFLDTDMYNEPMPNIRSHLFVGNRAVSGGAIFITAVNVTNMFQAYQFCSLYNACKNNRVQGYGSIVGSSQFGLGWVERVPGLGPPTATPPPVDPHNLPWPIPGAPACEILPVPRREDFSSANIPIQSQEEADKFHYFGDWDAWQSFCKNSDKKKSPRIRYTSPNELSSDPFLRQKTETYRNDVWATTPIGLDSVAYIAAKEMQNARNNLEVLDEEVSKLATWLDDEFSGHHFPWDLDSSIEQLSVMNDIDDDSRMSFEATTTIETLFRSNRGSIRNNVPMDAFGPIPIHSGVTKTLIFQATDQFGQMVVDSRVFPLGLILSRGEDVCRSPTQCGGATLATLGNQPVMMNGAITLDINLVLDSSLDPMMPRQLNVTSYFMAISQDTPMSWLSNMFFTMTFEIANCPPGYGFLEHGKPYCQICPYSTFNLNGNGICHSCADEANLQCYGNNLITDEDYWIYSNETTNAASVYLCPSGYCLSRSNACAPHRTGRLCAACEPGYAESLFTACTKCNRPNWALLALAFVLMWLVILVLHMLVAVSSGKSTILFYFVQTAILFASDVPFPWKTSDPNSSLCLFPMTPLTRRLVLLLVPMIMMLQIALTFAAQRIYMNLINPLLPAKYRIGVVHEPFHGYDRLTLGHDDPQATLSSQTRERGRKSSTSASGFSKHTGTESYLQDSDNEVLGSKNAASGTKVAIRRQLSRVDSFSSVEPSFTESAFLGESPPSSMKPTALKHGLRWVDESKSPDKEDIPTAGPSDFPHLIGTESESGLSSGEESYATDDENVRDLPPLPKVSSNILLDDEDSESDAFGPISQPRDHEKGLLPDEDDSDETDTFLRQPVPVFGFELSDDEESELDAELMHWDIVVNDQQTHEHFLRSERKRRKETVVQESLPTLSALKRWMYEKRFFHHYRLIRTLLALTSFSYSSMSTFVFTVFDCIPIKGTKDKFLKAQPDMLCDSEDFKAWRYAAISFIPILFAFFVSICYKLFYGFYKRQLTQSDVRFGIFYEMYKPEFFFWKIIELLRRSALTAIIVFINEHAVTRGLILSGACFAILVAQALAWPFRRKLENSLETLSTFILAIISIAAIWHAKDTSSAASLIIWVLIFCTTAIILTAFSISTFRRKILPFLRKHFPLCCPPKQPFDGVN